ncbi:hypothetical protein [Acuticoccus kandeliae]|uniref:hypothetical protein n=1 Tax=Acuticoccus kandeliae TaxID=2073160 RepID=UPI001300B110|nr:hypothetical protein [Acuticoccus kandeliae]
MLTGPVFAQDEQQTASLSGEWEGKGFVQKDEKSKPMNVRCKIAGEDTGDRIGFEGECRAMMIMKRAIGANLVRQGDTYSGTYLGSHVGVAQLEGGQNGPNTYVLTMTFPKEVNGDDVATMTIDTSGEGTFTITTVDRMETGDDITTSQITFERSARSVASQ